jgi:hypothetical protein
MHLHIVKTSRLRILFSTFLISSLIFSSSAIAAPKTAAPKTSATKSVALKKLDPLVSTPLAEGLVSSGKTLITYSNSGGANSNILITGLDANGTQQWQKTIDSGADEIALAATVDSTGNIWFAGDSAPVTPTDSATAQFPADNPDGVVAEPQSKLRVDMNLLTLWKVSPTGDLLATYSLAQTSPALINGISVNTSGISIIGQLEDKSFLVSVSSTGTFGKVTSLGTSKTQLNAVVRNLDGSVNVFGTSSETLATKKNVGIRDGILIKVSKLGTIATVVRSSAPKADRSWISADNALALTGYVKTGKVIETAFTKFTTAFAPTWTLRIPSAGDSQVLTAGATAFGALSSNSDIKGVSGWRPTTPQLAVLGFSSKGVITSAYGFPALATPLALTYSKDLGLYGLAKTADGSVSLFKVA